VGVESTFLRCLPTCCMCERTYSSSSAPSSSSVDNELFVLEQSGCDIDGDGTRLSPFRTLAQALRNNNDNNDNNNNNDNSKVKLNVYMKSSGSMDVYEPVSKTKLKKHIKLLEQEERKRKSSEEREAEKHRQYLDNLEEILGQS